MLPGNGLNASHHPLKFQALGDTGAVPTAILTVVPAHSHTGKITMVVPGHLTSWDSTSPEAGLPCWPSVETQTEPPQQLRMGTSSLLISQQHQGTNSGPTAPRPYLLPKPTPHSWCAGILLHCRGDARSLLNGLSNAHFPCLWGP